MPSSNDWEFDTFGEGWFEDPEAELLEEAALDYGTCHIILRDEVNCNIQGLKSFHREVLIKDWSLTVEGAYFMPAYKIGAWDGKIQYVKSNGNTYIHLLEDIVPWIVGLGYKIQLIDKRKNKIHPEEIDSNFLKGVALRYYQVDAVNEALKHGHGIMVLATAAGKTYINAALVKAYEPFRSLTIVPNADLVRQTAASFQKVGLDTGFYYGKKKELEHQHIVGTWQAIKNKEEILKDFQVAVVDEVHGAKAAVLFRMLTEKYGARIQYRFGMTGTLPKPKADKTAIKSALGPKIYELKAKELIDKGYLANLEITIAQLQDCITEHMTWDAEKAFLTRNKKRLAAISKLIISVSENGNTLVLVESIKAGQTLQAFIPGSIFLHGATDNDDRAEEYESFEKTDNKIVIATYGIARAGISIDRIFNMVLVDGGKAFVRAIQSIGRGLRKAADKHHVNVLDICSNGKYSQKHMKERVRYYKEAQYPYRIEKVDL
jgi:superfamily II DNA or RNA helicase